MSEKECDHHKGKYGRLVRGFLAGLLILLFILLVVFLITWAVLQPKKPQFVLQDATVYALNVSAPNFVSSTISLTISSRNPNDNIGIYYDKLDVYATYQDQQITYYTAIPPTYQGHHDVNVWSPYIVGTNVPVAPYNGLSLNQDTADGSIVLFIKIDGRVRWKVGTITTGDYHFDVTCPAFITFGSQSTGITVGNAIKYQLVQSCSVSV
ncbi:NDR1/HIN1-like protein 1 [Rhododendron vialii]|uniref:NDR1/HIN1-like protein 1 n=1 Tax=Rhododendron vialii TaxID=182163 RepID=UPI00265F511A|nr:NDR1/HIN1-like protein 1 [Rhododendron vialii]